MYDYEYEFTGFVCACVGEGGACVTIPFHYLFYYNCDCVLFWFKFNLCFQVHKTVLKIITPLLML